MTQKKKKETEKENKQLKKEITKLKSELRSLREKEVAARPLSSAHDILVELNAKAFFDLCCADGGPCEVNGDLDRKGSRIQWSYLSDKKRVKAYVLPESMPTWPSFYCSKQTDAHCPHIYFERVNDINTVRFDETIRFLNTDKKKSYCIGYSGHRQVNGNQHVSDALSP